MLGKTTEANHCTRSLAGNSCSDCYIFFSFLRGQKEGGFFFNSKSCLHIWEARPRPHGQQQMGTGWERRGERTGSQQEKQAPETIQSPETPLLSSHAKVGARPEACTRIKRNHKAVFPHAIHDNAFLSRLGSERILVARSTRSTDQRRGYGPRPEQGQWDFNPSYVPDNRVLTVLRGALRSLWEFIEKDSAAWYLVQSQCSEDKAWTEKIDQMERC